MVDFDALEAAGIANARDRAGLIEYLDGLGFTTEDMVDAERRGRLFGLHHVLGREAETVEVFDQTGAVPGVGDSRGFKRIEIDHPPESASADLRTRVISRVRH